MLIATSTVVTTSAAVGEIFMAPNYCFTGSSPSAFGASGRCLDFSLPGIEYVTRLMRRGGAAGRAGVDHFDHLALIGFVASDKAAAQQHAA